ncbi:ABC transporter ATP-binding protein [Amycolatopsis sp. K13G38]|uniref:ABC transporter ATP-binding protein n=1 Tax=Amycolatopsis acididurans TaxID=2724524 RepID=A0ABX1JFN5_9PSEU|nr:ABC transporter ATP-binding protein [Amycolatopsis acididurans]NKQ58204.1 ABC transporter ATP-binding protein [Amycolatopsis acididurans]
MPDLKFEDVAISYGPPGAPPAVRNVTLTVRAGSTFGLVGESGSGKSTLARAAVGLVAINHGRITLGQRTIADASTRHRRAQPARTVQMVFQDSAGALNPHRTAGQSIIEGIAASGQVPRSDFRSELERVLDLVHLHRRHADRHPPELSGGQRQRVALARAIAARPEVIVADEVTSALDVSVQSAILNLLCELQEQLALTVLFISHNLAAVRYLSHQIAVMRDGEIVDEGPAATLLADSSVPYTRKLVEAVLTIPPLAATR